MSYRKHMHIERHIALCSLHKQLFSSQVHLNLALYFIGTICITHYSPGAKRRLSHNTVKTKIIFHTFYVILRISRYLCLLSVHRPSIRNSHMLSSMYSFVVWCYCSSTVCLKCVWYQGTFLPFLSDWSFSKFSLLVELPIFCCFRIFCTPPLRRQEERNSVN